MYWAESQGKMADSFWGFRRNKSWADCLTTLKSRICMGMLRGEICGSLAIDVSVAYDGVSLA